MVSKEFLDSKKNAHTINKNSKTRFRSGVYVLVKNSNNEFLMIINENSKIWEIPGGGLEIGEDLIEGGIREIKEETGYDIKIESSLPFTIEKDLEYKKNEDLYQHNLNFFFLGKLISEIQGEQSFAEGENILKVEFISIDKLKTLDIAFWQKEALNKILEGFE